MRALSNVQLWPDCDKTAPETFGATVFAYRSRLGRSQSAVSAAAKLSAGYYSEVENGKRTAPPRTTAIRIARALHLSADEAAHLIALAEAERVAVIHDAHLAPAVRELLAAIRAVAPCLPSDAVACLRAKLKEVCM